MKCVICKNSDIQKKTVEEEIKSGRDIALIPMEVLVCVNCGESYYDSRAMRKIEELKDRLS
ncbi:MAG: YgiT-type zinc finger protein, partial [Nitrospirae bacterium]